MKILLLYEPSEGHLAELRRIAPGASVVVAGDEAATREQIVDAEVVLGTRHLTQALPEARQLRWVQASSVGVDKLLGAPTWPEGLTLTSAGGVFDAEIAEHVVALALALTRELHLLRDDQRERAWRPRTLEKIAGKRCLLLGYGSLGRRIGAALLPHGLQLEAVRRRHEGPPAADESGVLVHGATSWRAALGRIDLVVNTLPLTDGTRHLLGATELAALRPGARVINVGRGGTVDEQALLELLASGHLAGAALDVLEQEPPPPDSPLWREPKLLITPHIAHSVDIPPYPWEQLFAANVERYVRGQPLLNVVDQQAGY